MRAHLDTPTIAEVSCSPLPARDERGEGWGEGLVPSNCRALLKSPLPDPLPTSPPACRATSFCLLAASRFSAAQAAGLSAVWQAGAGRSWGEGIDPGLVVSRCALASWASVVPLWQLCPPGCATKDYRILPLRASVFSATPGVPMLASLQPF